METATIDSNETDQIISLDELLKDVSGLVSPPEVCFKVFELIDSKHGTAEALGDVILQDPNLTAKLLRIVNSAFYNFPSKIDTVSRAIAIVGSAELYSLVVAVKAVRCFSKIPADLVNIDSFWQHSLYTALIAKDLAKKCKILHPERLFIAGLLHDIGSLIIFNAMPEDSRGILNRVGGDQVALATTETEIYGYSHADVGSELMKIWNLPSALQEATKLHYSPNEAEEANLETCVLHLADSLANQTGMGTFAEEAPEEVLIDDCVWDALNLDKEKLDIDELMGEAGLKFAEMSSLLLSKAN
ncbi:MAG: HDOD domain-containing protein [Gammaproteobacteria bacterium]